ncbi:MAG: amidase [Acidobacteriia bacterium]|nr:amidase [Terriglobia bacterium]
MALTAHPVPASGIRLERLEQWLEACPAAREEAVAFSLERIRTLDPTLHAWVEVNPQPHTEAGRLAGIPYGAKDVIDAKDLVTEFGSPLYRGHRGAEDAAIVRQLHSAGAVLMGKTQTAAFAHRTPPPTRNPRNLDHTPGGSSSGSAAAVAAGMIPFALGTQTLGSVVRPASFCGITGFKPSHGLISMEGVLSMSPSLDTLGFFTHTPSDMLRLWEALRYPCGDAENVALGAVEPLPEVEAPMAGAFRAAVSLLRGRGLAVQPLPIAPLLEKLAGETRIVMYYEGARFHEPRFREYGDLLLDLADLVREGLEIPDHRYQEAQASIASAKQQMAALCKATPVILAPAATGPPPRGLTSTGDPRLNAPWTALGLPAIAFPMPAPAGLPLGLQLAAAHGEDARVLRAALRVASLLSLPG